MNDKSSKRKIDGDGKSDVRRKSIWYGKINDFISFWRQQRVTIVKIVDKRKAENEKIKAESSTTTQ